ncbi:MAG: calcium-binding protein [Pseudomonadota bacterium]
MTEADALNGDQIAALVSDGPGDLSAPAYTQDAVLVGDDDISGMGGNDTIYAGAGRDVVDGGSGNDLILGEYGADLLMGRGGADILDGGHGQDVLQGGMGNDVLLSRSDAREPKIAQLFDDEDPNGIPEDESGWAGGGATGPCPVTGGPVCHCGRDPEQVEEDDDPEYEIDPVSGQLYPSQPIPANDILTGGTGADTFRIETLINAKEDIILKHVRDDGTINWAGVAGENNRYHDHWVDSIGDDRITDFNRAEGDKIEIAGHTTEIASVVFDDLDGDGRDESTVIHLISNQGGNGGAHDQDYLGSITVENVILVEDDVSVDSNPTYGIVDTIYELDDAITPLYASDEEARTGFGTAGETPSMPPEATVVDPPAPAPAPAPSPEPTPTPAPEADGDGKPKQLFGDEGANTVNGTDAGEKIAALAGDDIVMGGDGRDLINGGTGNDTLHGEGGRDVLAGGDGDDELIGGADDDFGFGGNGDDTFQGGAGDDRFFGGAGNDTATGGIGDDVLAGRLDNDTLIGNGGDDVLIGGGGDNRLIGGTGDDQHSAGIGRNTIVYDEAGYGDDTVYGFSDDDLIEVSTDLAASFDDVTVVSVAPTRTELQFGNGSVTLVGVAANEINDADFIFA